MIDTQSEYDHSIITASAPLPNAEIFVARGFAKIRSIDGDIDGTLSGFITPKFESDRAAISALADKVEQYPELRELARRLRMTEIGGVIFN